MKTFFVTKEKRAMCTQKLRGKNTLRDLLRPSVRAGPGMHSDADEVPPPRVAAHWRQ
jgi:hypothetical protein